VKKTSDCVDPSFTKMESSNNSDMIQMFTAISSQLTSNYQALQDEMVQNDLHLSAEFQKVVQDNEMFKQDVHAEIDIFRNLLTQPHGSSGPPTSSVFSLVPDSSPVSSSSLLASTNLVNSNLGSHSSSPRDF
jgi:hypothetical protein